MKMKLHGYIGDYKHLKNDMVNLSKISKTKRLAWDYIEHFKLLLIEKKNKISVRPSVWELLL